MTEKTYVSESNLSFTVEIEKNRFNVGERIKVFLFLTNIGDQKFFVNSRMALSAGAPGISHDVEIMIINSVGERMPFVARVQIRRIDESDFIELKPDEVYEVPFTYAVNELYGLREPGSYTLTAQYRNNFDLGLDALIWKGMIPSNQLEFDIIP